MECSRAAIPAAPVRLPSAVAVLRVVVADDSQPTLTRRQGTEASRSRRTPDEARHLRRSRDCHAGRSSGRGRRSSGRPGERASGTGRGSRTRKGGRPGRTDPDRPGEHRLPGGLPAAPCGRPAKVVGPRPFRSATRCACRRCGARAGLRGVADCAAPRPPRRGAGAGRRSGVPGGGRVDRADHRAEWTEGAAATARPGAGARRAAALPGDQCWQRTFRPVRTRAALR